MPVPSSMRASTRSQPDDSAALERPAATIAARSARVRVEDDIRRLSIAGCDRVNGRRAIIAPDDGPTLSLVRARACARLPTSSYLADFYLWFLWRDVLLILSCAFFGAVAALVLTR